MRINYYRLAVISLITATLCACSDSAEQRSMNNSTQQDAETPGQTSAQRRFHGTIVYKNLEGGFFALIGNNNQRYTLRKLPREYQRDGLVVEITGKVNHDIMTFTQFGELLDVESVTVVDDSQVKTPAPAQDKLKSL